MNDVRLVLLGTGGGRFATITQKRRTAGIRILNKSVNIHLDPGPGALVYSVDSDFDPQKLNAILVSHSHPDHYTDAEVLIEAMTRATTQKRGILAAAKSVLYGNEVCEASISSYHQKMPKQIIEAKHGTSFQIGDMKITAIEARHTDPDAVGFRFETHDVGDFAYTSDTEYFEGIGAHYKGVRLLLLCVMRPSGKPWKGHMTTQDAVKILNETKPEMAILTHFGMQMIFKGPANEAKLIEQETGIPTTAATDGMSITIGEKIQIETSAAKKKQPSLNQFFKK